MTQLKLKILTICLLWMFIPAGAQEIWHESFLLPGKGVRGSDADTIHYDFTGINSWSLDYEGISLVDEGDYAQTVSTSGGRFEVCDIDGEVVWQSEWITIEGYPLVNVELTAAETGSGNNTDTKYMKVCYLIDGSGESFFDENGYIAGNWGSVITRQEGLSGSRLKIRCYMSNHYSSDKVILDEVTVLAMQEPLTPVQPFEVVINELMADPVPTTGLPEVEYIELFNTRSSAVRTEGWQILINGVSKNIPTRYIGPGEYLLLCATGSLDELQSFGNVINVPGFQGLLNKGATVEIRDGEGMSIDEITYTDAWYNDELKQNGGWSLERIDPLRNCNQKENWQACMESVGGTPGSRNSVYGDNMDDIAPVVRWAVAVSANEIEVAFSEPIDSLALTNVDNYVLSEFGNPDSVAQTSPALISLNFTGSFVEARNYVLQIQNLYDECSNQMSAFSGDIGWNVIEPGDILISEILFNPYPGCADFVEIYNHSSKIFDLSRLSLSSHKIDDELNKKYMLTEERILFYPEEYMVLTEDTASLFMHYHIDCRSCILQLPDLPAFPNAEGGVALLNEKQEVIDLFAYSEKMHSPFITDCAGISLERISFQEPAGNKNNWYSASEDAGYGTPGYKNSQNGPVLAGKPAVTFHPKAFSPNYDGYNDAFHIHYQTSGQGFVANVRVFDVAGRYVHTLAGNLLLGTEGDITWNGKDETGSRLPLGLYVVAIEIFNAGGELYRYKEGVVLTDVLY